VKQAYDSLKTDPPVEEEEERPPLTSKIIESLQSEADGIRSSLGSTVNDILAKRHTVTDPWTILDALHFCSCFQFMHGHTNTDTEQMVTACYWLPMEVNNGGFHQYFHNSAGDLWPYVLKVLEEGQEVDGLGRFLDLISIFPNRQPSVHRRKRWAQMQAIETANEKEVEAHFDCHTREFYTKSYPQPEVFWSVIEGRAADIRLPWSQ
jgi:hypothetical protein